MLHKYTLLKNGCMFACLHSALTLFNKSLVNFYIAPGTNWQIWAPLFPSGDWTFGPTGRGHVSLPVLPALLTTADLFVAPAPSLSWRMSPWLPTLIGDESAMQAGGGPPGFVVATRTTCCSGLSSASFFFPTTQTILTNDSLRHFQKNSEVTGQYISSWIPPG